jgi:hypothetical protein
LTALDGRTYHLAPALVAAAPATAARILGDGEPMSSRPWMPLGAILRAHADQRERRPVRLPLEVTMLDIGGVS